MEVSGSLNEKLNTFLFTYRITPQSTTDISHTEPLVNRKLNSKRKIIKPRAELNKNVFLPILPDSLNRVMIRNFSIDNKLILGTTLCCRGPISPKALSEKGIVKKHLDH